MKKLLSIILINMMLIGLIGQVAVASEGMIVISKVVVGTKDNASDELITLFNNTDQPQDISGYSVQYKSASGTSWTTRAQVADSTILEPFTAIEASSLRATALKLSAGLAQSGGNIRIVDSADSVIDQFAWGNGDSSLGAAPAAPQTNEFFIRRPSEGSLALVDTRNNLADFAVDGGIVQEDQDPISEETTTEVASLNLQITELLPDPLSPKTDSSDEFIEIYNPNNTTVNLAGWQLVDGGGKKFIFTNEVIAPYSHMAFYSKLTRISLNNGGDTIELINPAGDIVDTSPNYEQARAGLSWGLTDDGWTWTATPTPSAKNAAPAPVEAVKAATTKTKKSTASKAKKAAAKKATKNKAATALADSNSTNEDEASSKPIYSVWSWLLIAAGVGTIGYGIYEYRPELKAAYIRLKAKFGAGGKIR